MTAKLKYLPHDFQVYESCNIELNGAVASNRFEYYVLRKIGWTTFQAIEIISSYFDVPRNAIQWAGLKDEDAVTTQFISSSVRLDRNRLVDFNTFHSENMVCHMALDYYGAGSEPLTIGRLNGNGFRVVIRDLSEELGNALLYISRNKLIFFQNYYGTQRFGLPNCPAVTHRIGHHLIKNEYADALECVKVSGGGEANKAVDFSANPAMFFQSLDCRRISFYQNAHSSYKWNETLYDLSLSVGECFHNRISDDICFAYLADEADILRVMTKAPRLDYMRYECVDDKVRGVQSFRPSVIQTQITFGSLRPDVYHDGKFEVAIEFFLPAGCYATIVIEQIMYFAKRRCGYQS